MKPPRFLLLVCPAGEKRDAMAAHLSKKLGLVVAGADQHGVILSEQSDALLAMGEAGAVVGRIYPRGSTTGQIQQFGRQEAEAIKAQGAGRLVDRYWGRYVAILAGRDGPTIFRDPSGGQQCLWMTSKEAALFASDADLLRRARLAPLSISWVHLARHLYTNGLPEAATCLEGVFELLPGTEATVQDGAVRIAERWSPWDHVAIDDSQDEHHMAEALRATIESTIRACASPHRRLLIGVSGGLDSSIVAASLAVRREDISCFTMATRSADGDERVQARLVCDHLGLPLVEARYSHDDVDLDRSAAPHLPRPTSRAVSQPYDAVAARLIAERDIDAFFSGNGGDNVFSFSMSAAALVDRARYQGPTLGLFRTLADICAMTGGSPRQAIAQALRIARAGPAYRWQPMTLFLAREAVERQTPITHPWLEAPAGALAGKAVHISLLLRTQQHLQACEGTMGAEVVTPLMTQPVIEACLHIPSWRWCSGGINRAVARRAFEGRLPLATARRVSKGGPSTFAFEIVERNRAAILRRLLDGRLARHGLLDTAAITHALIQTSPKFSIQTVRLLTLIEAEAWSAHWEGVLAAPDGGEDLS
jgi:asparagine synthase (glutamine-hydrolysing)